MEGCGCTGGYDDNGYKLLRAAIIVLLLLILFYLMQGNQGNVSERYIGSGLNSVGFYTSGATLRRLGQLFSSTNQGVQTTVYNADVCKPWESGVPCGNDVGVHVIMYPHNPQVLATPI
jgi:hypothetical protein